MHAATCYGMVPFPARSLELRLTIDSIYSDEVLFCIVGYFAFSGRCASFMHVDDCDRGYIRRAHNHTDSQELRLHCTINLYQVDTLLYGLIPRLP